jgi:surfactin family lipopeptide synthetase A
MPQPNTAKFILRLLDSFKANEDKIAVVDQNGQRQTTYKELFTMACRVAGYLHKNNYPPHSFIGICLPTSMEYVASEIGIWLAGHAIVPMGDKYPKDRIDYIMHHCEASLLIDEETFKAIAEETPIEIYSLPNEDDTMALYYTSGSTGNPKGVIHTYYTFDFSQYILKTLRNITPLVMGMTLSMFYMVSEYLFVTLCVGGKAVIVPPSVIRDIRQLESFYLQHHITFAFFTPSLLRFFRNQSSDLQLVMVTSERLSGIGPGNYKMINLYGQTETGEACFKFDIDKAYENTPIGKPLQDHLEYRILQDDLQEVAPGEEGELCLRGRLSPGYYKDPQRTEELWRGGWLHTGDIVREMPDGNILYVNRKDWMVKINGQRVEPGEVEAVLKQVDSVENAIVKGFTTKDRQFLCAYYITNKNVSEDTIRAYLRSKLPEYMIPAYFVRMDSFPLLPNGKTDRKSLLAPVVNTESFIRPTYAAPTNNVERQLCEAFEKTLTVDRVGIDDDFFDLGGDSIRVMEVQTLCPELTLSSRMIYANRTPKKIAEACAHTEQVNYDLQKDYPLSQTQLGIYVECMSRQGEVAYNNGMLFQMNPAIDADRLSKACETVVEAHPYIKTRLFVDSQGNPRQLRNDAEIYHQNVETLTQQALNKLKSKLIRPFDLLKDRLFRIRILKTPEALYLFIDFHHIIFDGVSFNIILRDLMDAYEQLPVRREEFTGYEIVLEEESLRKTNAYAIAKKWYQEQFGTLKVSSLPLPEKQESQNTYGQEHLELTVDYHQLLEACHHLNVTPNVLTTTVFGYLLGVNTHAQESLFATVFSGRQDLKTQRTVTMLVKTLPVYTKWDKETTVWELLQATKQQLMGSMSNSLFSFAEIRAMNNTINSHILFAYQGDLMPSDSELFTYQPLMENATGEDLAFEILRSDSKLILHTEYHSNQYTQSFIRRLMQCYNTILEGFLNTGSEDKHLYDLQILTDDEQQAILALGTGDQLDYDRSETIVDLFHRQATLSPDNIAVVDEVSEITYAELDCKSDLLATTLRKAGVSTDTFVAIMLPRRKEFLIAAFAVFKAGGAYIPLDSDYPKERLAYILDDSEAHVLITTSTLSKDCQTEQYFPREKQLLIDDFDFNGLSDHLVNFAQPSGLAYMIYTSGTTGKPKGVTITHEAMMNFIVWLKETEELKAGEQCAIHTNFVFDGSLFDLYPPLISGATLHVLSSALRMDLHGMCRYFNDHHIAGLLLTTQIGMMMMGDYELPLRFLMVGGEKLTTFRVPSSMTLYNCYGPTEFTVCSSFHQIDSQRQYNNIPIGRPAPNTMSVIVDNVGRLVPPGTVGELCLIGRQLSRGYWKQDELTKECFVDCSFLSGQKMYRTGDLVRWNEDRQLEYIGRIDNQVKLHGYRIELGEIESKISHCSGVVSAAVFVHKQGNNEFIVAYYTSEGNKELLTIQETLMAELPSYMVPSQLIRIDQMPLTPNGKIDRQSLPTPVLTSETRVAPETEMEKQVLELITDQLKTTEIGVTDNLLHWGLSSLAAMRLSALLQHHFEVYVKMAEIMKHPTVRAIASLLSQASDSTLPVYERRASYPLMENQRGLYLEWKKNPDTTQYNIPFVYGFEGLDADRLVNALKQVVNAHPYLKSKLMEVDDEVILQRNDQDPVEIKVTELCEEPEDTYFQKRVLPFHLLGDQLYRFEVIKTPRKTYLFFDVHHIIFDGLSRKVLLKDLKRAYEGKILKKESYQAYDFALYEQEELRNTEKTQEAESWYDELLTDANALSVPSYLTPDGVDYATIEISLPSHQIDTFCAVNDITVNSFMHAAFAIFIKRLIKEKKPLYLTISSGRDLDAYLQQCIGMFVKTMPIVITSELVQGQSTADFVKEVHKQLQKSYSMDYYPYTKIVARHRVNAELMFLYQDEVGKNYSWEASAQTSLSSDTTKFPISVIITPETDSYHITLEYDGKRYNSQGMRQMVNAFRNILLNMAVTATVSDVELISPDEKSELLELSRGETIEYDNSETIVDLFHCQATLRPDNIAVVDDVSEITYAELDRRSDVLATALIKAGVGTDTFVAIMLPRRKEYLIAMFAVFKAGGAFIPLDSEYPKERLAYILNNSDAHVLITTSTLLKDCQTEQYFPRGKQLLIDDFDFNEPSDHPVNFAQPSALAYMIYTSGTTGMPKGVMIEHKNLRAFLQFRIDLLHLTQEDRCAQHASFSFDASLDDLLSPLVKGAQVHILSAELRQDIKGMNDYFMRYKITGLTMSTQLGVEMLSQFSLPLRYLMLGGSKMPHVPTGNTNVINGYGPTEFTVCSSYYKLEQDERHDNIPIGRPVPNSISVVVDTEGHLVPQGIVGELCLIGSQMSRGYWKQEKLTKERFVDCSFLDDQKMYRTGDLVRWNEEGLLEYMGRIDNQVKLHGYRIELEEIENKISQCPGVISTAVVVHKQGNVEFLVAYYTSEGNKELLDIQKTLMAVLPSYMVPSQLIRIDEMPKTPNGKIDRRRLKESVNGLLDTAGTLVKPSNQKEQVLLDLTKTLLGIDSMGVTDDLTLLGLSSIDAIRLADMAHREGLYIKVNDILRSKSIRDILINKQSVGKWENGYDTSKPVIVLIQGFTYYKKLEPLISKLCKHYSVFVIEPIDDHYEAIFNEDNLSCNDVVNFYLDYLEANLPSDVSVEMFVGHSFGGELAYRCAVRWHKKTGAMPKVCLLDTFAYVANTAQEIPVPEIGSPTPDEASDIAEIKEWNRHLQKLQALKDNHDLPTYDGDILYFKAEDQSLELKSLHVDMQELNMKKQEDSNIWSMLAPHMSIYPVAAGHLTMLDERFSNNYLEKIDDIVLPHNS